MTRPAPPAVPSRTPAPAGGTIAFAVVASALPDGAPPEWIKLAPLGRVTGRDGRGPYDFGDRARAAAVVAASLAYAAASAAGPDPVDLFLDYDHAFDLSAIRGLGPAPAAGWIKGMEARDDGIWARVEWTARAAAQLAAKEYRYVSPTFAFAAGGAVLRIERAALTNHPNLNLPALASVQSGQPEPPMDPTLAAFLDALGLPPATTVEVAAAHARGMAAAHRADLDRLAAASGLSAGSTADAIATALAAAQSADPAKYVPMEIYTATASALATMQAAKAETDAAKAVDDAVAAGRVAPATRAHFLAVYKANPAGWASFAAALPVVVAPNTQTVPPGAPPVTVAAATGDEAKILSMMGVDPDAAAKVKAEMGW